MIGTQAWMIWMVTCRGTRRPAHRSSGSVIGTFAWIATVICASGCHGERRCELPDASPVSVEGFELCERLPTRLGRPCAAPGTTCESTWQCPDGLTCMKQGSADPTSPAARCFEVDDADCRCRPLGFGRLAIGAGRFALQQGFSVGGMPSSIEVAEGPPRLIWQAPPGARYVACALFACPPRFETFGCSPTDENALAKIDNFQHCVLLFDAAPATQPGFLLSQEHAYNVASRCTLPAAGPRVVLELAAGCWAYDTTSIIAATELHPIRGSLLADLPGIPHDAACEMDGDACYDATADVFGVCLAGACTPRCRSAADCALADPTPSTRSTCGWSCYRPAGHELGACVRQP